MSIVVLFTIFQVITILTVCLRIILHVQVALTRLVRDPLSVSIVKLGSSRLLVAVSAACAPLVTMVQTEAIATSVDRAGTLLLAPRNVSPVPWDRIVNLLRRLRAHLVVRARTRIRRDMDIAGVVPLEPTCPSTELPNACLVHLAPTLIVVNPHAICSHQVRSTTMNCS